MRDGNDKFVRYATDFLAGVKKDDYEAVVLENDDEARKRLRQALDGVDLYFHGGPNLGDGYVWVTIEELVAHRVIKRVTLHASE